MSRGHHRAAELGVGDVKAAPSVRGGDPSLVLALCRLQATTRAALGAEGPKPGQGDGPFFCSEGQGLSHVAWTQQIPWPLRVIIKMRAPSSPPFGCTCCQSGAVVLPRSFHGFLSKSVPHASLHCRPCFSPQKDAKAAGQTGILVADQGSLQLGSAPLKSAGLHRDNMGTFYPKPKAPAHSRP